MFELSVHRSICAHHIKLRLKFAREICTFWFASILLGFNAMASEVTDIELWRLDCGQMIIDDISYFSDSYKYEGQSAKITNGCYLVRHGDQYLLWDAGLPRDVLGNTTANNGWTSSINVTIEDQLKVLGLEIEDIDFLSVSHFHGDHIGQAAEFTDATLLMSGTDATWIREHPSGNARRRLAPWFDETANMQEFSGDHDVFGDGRGNDTSPARPHTWALRFVGTIGGCRSGLASWGFVSFSPRSWRTDCFKMEFKSCRDIGVHRACGCIGFTIECTTGRSA